MDLIKKILLYLWQLPQNLIGLILTKLLKSEYRFEYRISYYAVNGFFNSAISLGKYILIDNVYLLAREKVLENVLKHEKGHSIQSKYLGWFYLFVIGIPSIVRNIYDRVLHKKWLLSDRMNWYYDHFPENWADKLGGVNER